MEIHILPKNYREGSGEGLTMSLRQAVERRIDGHDYDTGQLEAMENTIANLANLVATLIAQLKLSDEQLTELVGRYNEQVIQAELK